MKKTIGIQRKPELDLEELDKLAEENKEDVKEEVDDNEEPEEEVKEVEKEIEKEPEKPEIDYKEKFKESSKEAMILRKQLEEKEAEKTQKVEINEEFMRKLYPEWDELTTGEQKALKKAEELNQQIQDINNRTNEFNNDKKWIEKVNAFIEDDAIEQFPQLKGREDQLRKFANKPTRKGLPMDDLVKIFLWENPEEVKPKRSLFHAPGGPEKAPEKADQMSAEEVAKLRVTDNRKYMQMIREGKIKLDL
jgi:DNA repair exonuclease SbcCD ATPase subunit